MSKLLETARELVKMLEEQEKVTKVELSACEPGQIIESNGNKYRVLNHLGNGTTLIMPMFFMLENVQFDSNTKNYKRASLKQRIETECLPVFEKDFGVDNLVEHEVDLTEHTLRVTSNCNRYPKKWRFSLVDKWREKKIFILTASLKH